jgi:hypothetical protein
MYTCNLAQSGSCGVISTRGWNMFHKYKNFAFFLPNGDAGYASGEDELYIRVCNLDIPSRKCRDGYHSYHVIAHVDLVEVSRRRACRKIYEVAYTRIDRKFQGFNLAPRLYRQIIKALDITLCSGETQSPGGRNIWVRLNQMRGILVCGAVGSNQTTLELVDNDDGELVSDRRTIYGTEGYRLYAVAV